MNILYVGHPAHKWSGSSNFFKMILEKLAYVVYIEPNPISIENDLLSALETNYDLYVFFQFDFMAYAFLSAGKNVLIVPMVDGSGGYGTIHWRLLKDAKFITFSKSLDYFLRIQNMNTHNIKYWPEPMRYISPLTDDIYFWPRGSKFPLTIMNIDKIFGGNRSIIVRLSTDDPIEIDSLGKLPDSVCLKRISNREEHFTELQNSSIFVAPRISEGIGHSFLEALSFGRSVVANNYPVMSEYISPYSTGMLISKHTRPFNASLDWIQMGRNAHKSVSNGRKFYLDCIPELEKFILSPVKKVRIKSVSKTHKLLKLSIDIYKEEKHINGVLTLSHFSRLLTVFNSNRVNK